MNYERSSYVTIKNKCGTSRNPKKNGISWKDYWEENSLLDWPDKCQCCKMNEAVLGGHVIIAGASAKEYIVPMCSSCNGQCIEFKNVNKEYLVPVCDKN